MNMEVTPFQENVSLDSLYDKMICKQNKWKEIGNDSMSNECICEVINSIISLPLASCEGLEKRKHSLSIYKQKLKNLLQLPKIEQRTREWFDLRSNMITASDLGQSLGEGKFGTPNQIFKKKCGYEEEVPFNNYIPPLKWGCMFECIATEIYMRRQMTHVHEFGILRHPTIPYFGASPDGITSEGIMLEIKCPFKRKITGEIPLQYFYQIQGQLEVCDLEECDYLECGFKEYDTEDCFFEDDKHPYEKGVIIEYTLMNQNQDNIKPQYLYSDIKFSHEIMRDDILNWINSAKEELKNKEKYDEVDKNNIIIHFWKLEVYNVVRVYRDKIFMENKLHELFYFWKKIESYRNDKDLYMNEVCVKKTRNLKKDRAVNGTEDEENGKSDAKLVVENEKNEKNENNINEFGSEKKMKFVFQPEMDDD